MGGRRGAYRACDTWHQWEAGEVYTGHVARDNNGRQEGCIQGMWHVAPMGGRRGAYRVLIGKPERKIP
jgi:hypothetical protein